MKQKRAILLILALMMLVSCAACGTAEDRSEAILQAAQQATTLPAPSDYARRNGSPCPNEQAANGQGNR